MLAKCMDMRPALENDFWQRWQVQTKAAGTAEAAGTAGTTTSENENNPKILITIIDGTI